MGEKIHDELYNAIVSDNAKAFSSLINNCSKISYGRFPILTLCYLYDSKKIIRKHEKELLAIDKYTIIDEKIEIYLKFKSKVGKMLRFYAGKDKVIQPIEMLAMLGKDAKVKHAFNQKRPKNINTIKNIYSIHGQDVVIAGNKLKISQQSLGYKTRRLYIAVASVCMCFSLMLGGLLAVFNFTTGLGTKFSPFVVATQSQLLKALNGKAYYVLKDDIVLDVVGENIEFCGNIDGANHTITIKDDGAKYIIKTNSGTISNINIIHEDINREISRSLSLFVESNYGTINNVNVICNQANLNCEKLLEQDIFINGICNTNNGKLINCDVKLNLNVTTSGDGECYTAGVCGTNNGLIDKCAYIPDSSINSLEADVSGIASINGMGATIKNCNNQAQLKHVSNKDGWNPNVAGIAMLNYGEIINSSNNAPLSVICNNPTAGTSSAVYVGGITCNNYASIVHSISYGDMQVESKNLAVYCGGISAYTIAYRQENVIMSSPMMMECGFDADIQVTTEHEQAYVFAGGISGYIREAQLSKCFSLATFSTDYSDIKYFCGTAFGMAKCSIMGKYVYFDFLANSNCVLNQANAPYVIGALLNGSLINPGVNLQLNGVGTYDTKEQLKAQEVYWHE